MWLSRGSRKVFYLCRRVKGVPRQFRVGTGPLAEKMSAELEARKAARKTATEAHAAKAKVRAAEDPLDALCADLERLVAGHLLTLGYHRHDRGPWRKKRERREMSTD